MIWKWNEWLKREDGAAAIESVKAYACVDILMRQCKYLNNIARQDYPAIKRSTRVILGCKSFWSVQQYC
jgi:transposase-like protein